MDVFIGNIPDTATETDLQQFCQPVVNGDVRYRIVEKELRNNSIRFGLICIASGRQARNAVMKLNGRLLRTHRVIVKEYIHRSCANERRALNWRLLAWERPERRHQERRGRGVLCSAVSPAVR